MLLPGIVLIVFGVVESVLEGPLLLGFNRSMKLRSGGGQGTFLSKFYGITRLNITADCITRSDGSGIQRAVELKNSRLAAFIFTSYMLTLWVF